MSASIQLGKFLQPGRDLARAHLAGHESAAREFRAELAAYRGPGWLPKEGPGRYPDVVAALERGWNEELRGEEHQ